MDYATALNTELRYNPHSRRFFPYDVHNEICYHHAREKNIIYLNSAFMYYCIGESNLDSLLSLGVDLRSALGVSDSKRNNFIDCKFIYKNYSLSTCLFYPDIIFNFCLSDIWYSHHCADVGRDQNTKLEVVDRVKRWVLEEIPEAITSATFGVWPSDMPF